MPKISSLCSLEVVEKFLGVAAAILSGSGGYSGDIPITLSLQLELSRVELGCDNIMKILGKYYLYIVYILFIYCASFSTFECIQVNP